MKSRTLCACLVVMMSVSTVALGEIIMDSFWDGYGDVIGYFAASYATASAIGSQTFQNSHAYGWCSRTTTEPGSFDWWYYCEAGASAFVFREDQYKCWAGADCWGATSLEEIGEKDRQGWVYAVAYVDEGDAGPPPSWAFDSDGLYSMTDFDTSYFEAYDAIYAGHTVDAKASIFTGSDNEAYGIADAGAVIDLDPTE